MRIKESVFLFFLFCFALSYGQVEYKVNTVKEKEFITEVYGNQLNEGSQHYKNILDLLRNRIVFIYQLKQINEKYPKLSDISLFDKYSNTLYRDTSYNRETFNPLKYNLAFYETTTRVYRIDDEWLLVINPQIIKR